MNRIRKQGETSSAGEALSVRGLAAGMITAAVETGASGGFKGGAASGAHGGDAETISAAAQVWLPASPDCQARM